MVKFGERMATETVPEWEAFYVDYKVLTEKVQAFAEANPHPTQSQRQHLEREFLDAVEGELNRADNHYAAVFDDLEVRCAVLRTAPQPSSPTEFVVLGTGEKRKRGVKFQLPGSTASAGESNSGNEGERQSEEEFSQSSHRNSSMTLDGVGMTVGKKSFQDWFHQAENLQRFSELASEAVRKAAKKAEKNVEGVLVKHLCALAFEKRDMHARAPDLINMIELVKREYEHRYHRSLAQFDKAEIKKARWEPKYSWAAAAVAGFMVILWLPILDGKPEAHGCLALFTLVITLWITEAFPYFATALLIPLVAVPLHVLHDPDTQAPAEPNVAARMLLAKMFENVQILVLGGLTMAKALDKSHLAGIAENFLHRHTARRPELYMLGVMATGCFLCIFVSNVAAPVLVLGVVRRTLNRMPRGDTAAPQRAMLLGLAFACNLGGMLSPIASPQNAVALHVLSLSGVNISFGQWLLITAPFVIAMLAFAWAVLLYMLKPFDHMPFVPLPEANKAVTTELSKAQRLFVLGVCVLTALLWCFNPVGYLGGPAMVALIPIVSFFGFGILEKDDFNTLSWHLIFLLAGGSMLGLCALSSGLLSVVSHAVLSMLSGASQFEVIVAVVVGVGIITTFVSHTVAAMVLLPLIGTLHVVSGASHKAVVGAGVSAAVSTADENMGTVLIIVAVLMCSGAMAFPISSFPNVNSLLAEDEQGKPWLSPNDYIVPGAIVTIACGVVLIVCEANWAWFLI